MNWWEDVLEISSYSYAVAPDGQGYQVHIWGLDGRYLGYSEKGIFYPKIGLKDTNAILDGTLKGGRQ